MADPINAAEVARARSLILDLFARWDAAGTCATAFDHPAIDLPSLVVNEVSDALVREGFIVSNWEEQRDGIPILTASGRRYLASLPTMRGETGR